MNHTHSVYTPPTAFTTVSFTCQHVVSQGLAFTVCHCLVWQSASLHATVISYGESHDA